MRAFVRIDKTYFNHLIGARSRPPPVATTRFIAGGSSIKNHQGEKFHDDIFSVVILYINFLWNEITNFRNIVIVHWIIQIEKPGAQFDFIVV
jgi:hypothetical protein